MVKGVLTGLLLLVIAVFAYVGYSGYAARQPSALPEVYRDGMTGGRAKGEAPVPATSSLPATPSTGSADGLVAQGGAAPGASGMVPPTADSIVPNPPNGMTFGGSGHYQLYRQGDLTWRLNTDTGETCVIFATDEEWRKPKVFQSGCRGK